MKVIANYEDVCGECPVWDGAETTLYWTDIAGRRFYRYRLTSGDHQVVRRGIEIAGFRRNRGGGFVVTNSGGVWLWNEGGTLDRVVSTVEGFECRMNDCTADPAGRLLSGTCYYEPGRDYRTGVLLRVDTDGRAAVLDDGIHMSNGLDLSPDHRTLYYSDSIVRRIYAYDYDVETGRASRRRVLVQVSLEEGLPDGLCVDSEGFLWSAQWYGSRIVRYDPDGKVERRLEVPAKQPTALTFGGPDLTDIFITTAGLSGPLPVMPPGYDPVEGYFGGALFQTNLGIQGQPARAAAIAVGSHG